MRAASQPGQLVPTQEPRTRTSRCGVRYGVACCEHMSRMSSVIAPPIHDRGQITDGRCGPLTLTYDHPVRPVDPYLFRVDPDGTCPAVSREKRARLARRAAGTICHPRIVTTNNGQGTQQERSRTRIVLALQVCTTAAHRDVDAAPMERWSDRGLQVTNLKATGAQLSSAQTNTGHDQPHTIILAPPCMHQTCCMHLQLGARRLSVETV